MEGNISLREDEEPKLIVNKAMLLDENGTVKNDRKKAKKELPKSFSKIYLRFDNLTSDAVSKVKAIISTNRGSINVIFYDSSSKSYVPYNSSVDLNIDVYNILIDILGEENVVPK